MSTSSEEKKPLLGQTSRPRPPTITIPSMRGKIFRQEVGQLYPDDPFQDPAECAVTSGSTPENEASAGATAERNGGESSKRPDVQDAATMEQFSETPVIATTSSHRRTRTRARGRTESGPGEVSPPSWKKRLPPYPRAEQNRSLLDFTATHLPPRRSPPFQRSSQRAYSQPSQSSPTEPIQSKQVQKEMHQYGAILQHTLETLVEDLQIVAIMNEDLEAAQRDLYRVYDEVLTRQGMVVDAQAKAVRAQQGLVEGLKDQLFEIRRMQGYWGGRGG